MKLAYDNALVTATLSEPNENANYPLENLYHKWKRRVYKSTATNTTITAVLDHTQDITCIGVAYHNLTSCSVKFYNALDALLDTWTVDVSEDIDMVYGDAQDVAKIEFLVESIVPIYIGSLFAGEAITFYKSADQDMPLNSSDVVTSSSDQQASGRQGTVYRSGNVSIPLLTSTERKSLESAFLDRGLILPFYLDLWDNSHADFLPLYGRFASSLSISHLQEGDTVSFDFQEVN
jgi:hypothetical protein